MVEAGDTQQQFQRLVAQLATDDELRDRMRIDPIAVAGEYGIDFDGTRVDLLENTATRVYMPLPAKPTDAAAARVAVTGTLPAWHAEIVKRTWDDPAFARQLQDDPDAVYAEMGIHVSKDVEIVWVEDTDDTARLVMPALAAPAEVSGFTDYLGEAWAWVYTTMGGTPQPEGQRGAAGTRA